MFLNSSNWFNPLFERHRTLSRFLTGNRPLRNEINGLEQPRTLKRSDYSGFGQRSQTWFILDQSKSKPLCSNSSSMRFCRSTVSVKQPKMAGDRTNILHSGWGPEQRVAASQDSHLQPLHLHDVKTCVDVWPPWFQVPWASAQASA